MTTEPITGPEMVAGWSHVLDLAARVASRIYDLAEWAEDADLSAPAPNSGWLVHLAAIGADLERLAVTTARAHAECPLNPAQWMDRP